MPLFFFLNLFYNHAENINWNLNVKIHTYLKTKVQINMTIPSQDLSWWRRLEGTVIQSYLVMRLQDVLQRCSQDVFKTYHQVKLFLLARLWDVFNTFLRLTARRLSTEDLPGSYFWQINGQCTKFVRVIKISQVLVFQFTTPFSGCLQRRI